MIVMITAIVLLGLWALLIKLGRRKDQTLTTKYKDIGSILALGIGGATLWKLLMGNDFPQTNHVDRLTTVLQIAVPIIILVFLVVHIVLSFTKVSRINNDERTELGFVKSSRNALLVTYVVLCADMYYSLALTRNEIIILLASGYFAFMGSSVYYRYLQP
jgi:quinol-cytochrome oxidoreductase complex cytochrome b subunit